MKAANEPMTEEFVRDFEALFKDPSPVTLKISKYQAWCLMAAVQLASRHPEGRTTAPVQAATMIARDLQSQISNTPTLARIAELGWTE